MQYNARHACPLLKIKVSSKIFFFGEVFNILLNRAVKISTIDKHPPTCEDFALWLSVKIFVLKFLVVFL